MWCWCLACKAAPTGTGELVYNSDVATEVTESSVIVGGTGYKNSAPLIAGDLCAPECSLCGLARLVSVSLSYIMCFDSCCISSLKVLCTDFVDSAEVGECHVCVIGHLT